MSQPQEHPDPLAEAGQRFGQSFAVGASIVEAAAHYRAAGLRGQATEPDAGGAGHDAAAAAPDPHLANVEQARRLVADHDRLRAAATQPRWAWRQDLTGLMGVWSLAGEYHDKSRWAGGARVRVEEEMRRRWPAQMRTYDEMRLNGKGADEAMDWVAGQVREHNLAPFARPHDRPDPRGIGSVGHDLALRRSTVDLLDPWWWRPDPASRSVAQLAAEGYAGPAGAVVTARDELGRPVAAQLMPASAATRAWAASLRGLGGDERRAAFLNAGAADNPATTRVDEHQVGVVAAGVDHGQADRAEYLAATVRGPAALAGQGFATSPAPAGAAGVLPATPAAAGLPVRTARRR